MQGQAAGKGKGAKGSRQAAARPAQTVRRARRSSRAPLDRRSAFQIACSRAAKRTRATAEVGMAGGAPAGSPAYKGPGAAPARGGPLLSRDRHEGKRRGQPSAAIAAAVSSMRQEKPHSLSYQEATRASLPSSTLTAPMSTVELAGLPLKSIETSGSSW